MPSVFSSLIKHHPIAEDQTRAADALEALTAHYASAIDPDLAALVGGAAGSSHYISTLISREAEWLASVLDHPPKQVNASLLADTAATVSLERFERASALRQLKRRVALYTALADLGGIWALEDVTGALSDFADAATDASIKMLVADEVRRGRLPACEDGTAGLFALSMGKGGARELNYSSDIDLIFLFDETRYQPDELATVRARLIKVVQGLVKLMSAITGDGYVFRVDLRLRPDPSVTPVCVSTEAAERYYESLGRTWERAAFIKSRAAAGDIAAGEALLKRLSPFIWRRHLDFAAVADAHDIRSRIRAHRGSGGRIAVPGHDVKLGRGGIREIEFFVQTRQLIHGGRELPLRTRGTREGLRGLVTSGRIDAETAATLDAAYLEHRRLEHALQMVNDAQTHQVPVASDAMQNVADLLGERDAQAYWQALHDRLETVDRIAESFFAPSGETGAPPAADPLPAASAEGCGMFANPNAAAQTMAMWHALPAARSERAGNLLQRLEPAILRALSCAASPDEALAHFDRFLAGLPAGVQLFSLFDANPKLLELIAEICAAAPRLADHLGKNAKVLDALLDRDFFEPLPDALMLEAELSAILARESDYERKLDTTRRWANEMRFRMGVQLLRGLADGQEAGRGYSAIAQASLRCLMPEVERDFARRHGPAPGRGACVLALGKMGSAEMTATSDLDLILLYDAAGVESSDGPRPLPATTWYARFTKAFLSAITAPTAEGILYEIDMRLRPSGRQGTVATSFSGFREYQAEKAWTWEHLALTRARAVAGNAALCEDAEKVVSEVLSLPREELKLMMDAADMRKRVSEAHGVSTDIWEVKHHAGGLMDIGFALQALALRAHLPAGLSSVETIAALEKNGALCADQAALLTSSVQLQNQIQQLARIAIDGKFDGERAGAALRAVIARDTGCERFSMLAAKLENIQLETLALVEELLPELPDPALASA